jgi:hypothetical protein
VERPCCNDLPSHIEMTVTPACSPRLSAASCSSRPRP